MRQLAVLGRSFNYLLQPSELTCNLSCATACASGYQPRADRDFSADDMEVSYGRHEQRKPRRRGAQWEHGTCFPAWRYFVSCGSPPLAHAQLRALKNTGLLVVSHHSESSALLPRIAQKLPRCCLTLVRIFVPQNSPPASLFPTIFHLVPLRGLHLSPGLCADC